MQLFGEARDIVTIDQLAADAEHARDVAEVLLRPTFLEVDELADDHVLGSGHENSLSGGNRCTLAAGNLLTAPFIRTDNHKVDLIPRYGVNDVERSPALYGFCRGRLAHIEFVI